MTPLATTADDWMYAGRMGMVANFRRVSSRQIERLRENPAGIVKVLFPDATETMIDDDVRLALDQTWHGLHYLMSGEAGTTSKPLGFILGGQPFGDINVGNGPARGFASAEVRTIGAALALITPQALKVRFDGPAMSDLGIYPGGWNAAGLTAVLAAFDQLKNFVTVTAQAEAGIITYLR